MNVRAMMRQAAAWAVLLVATVAGCGGSEDYVVAPAEGRVLCDGQPVPGVTVVLSPVDSPDETGRPAGFAGKGASGVTADDGTFVLSTYDEGDGALIGRHRVSLEVLGMPEGPEDWRELEPEDLQRYETLRDMPCALQPDVTDVTIEPGDNELTINLQAKE